VDPNAQSLLYIPRVIDLIPEPALVYLRAEDRIFSSNNAFQNLTAYSHTDLQSLRLASIMPDEPDTNPTTGEARPIMLQTASGQILFVLLKVVSLSPTNQVVLLVCSPTEEENPIRQDLLDQEYRYDNLKLLTEIGEQRTVQAVYQEVIRIIQRVFKPEVLMVYHRAEDELLRSFPANKDDIFPDSIPVPDLALLSGTTLWREGKPVQTPIENVAEEAELGYLVSVPILIDAMPDGLLLLAGHGTPPGNEDLRYLSLLSAHCSSVIKNLSTLESARQTLKNVRHITAIQQKITENLQEGIIILTPDLRITEMNPAAETILGYASSEVFQQKADMVLIGNETLSTLYKSAQQGIPSIVGDNLNLNNRAGACFPAQVLCLPVVEKKVVKSIVLILRDLSQSEKIREHSQQLEQRAFLGEVSAIFAHEVRNPINSISTGLQLIGLKMEPDAPYADLVIRLQNDCTRLTHLVKSTLTFSKPVEYQIQPVDLTEMIPSILDRWGPRMTRLNIEYNFNSSSGRMLVKADPRAIEQVFVNLISNAIQAMEEKGGSLNVKMNPADPQTSPPQCEIIIADSGPGIPDDVIGHIFEPFLTTKSSGTGLGLAITKRIVSAHEGNIFVESFPGGSMFHVLLPIVE
jgi:PAS domain S-box-containing protein